MTQSNAGFSLTPPVEQQRELKVVYQPVKWKQLISQHLGRSLAKRSHRLMVDLLSVDCGLKSALLLDFAVPSMSSIHSFLGALKHSCLLRTSLHVVTVSSDVLIINPAAFEGLKNSCDTLFSSTTFVDVSGNLDSPRLSPSNCEQLQNTKACFETFLTTHVTDLPICPEGADGNPANPSTLFGLFLGYPVVYFYDMSLETHENCLAMVPLVNFFLHGILCQDSNRISKVQEHTVMSFSVPEMFMSETVLSVEAWFEGKKQNSTWGGLFSDLRLERKLVQLPSVCL